MNGASRGNAENCFKKSPFVRVCRHNCVCDGRSMPHRRRLSRPRRNSLLALCTVVVIVAAAAASFHLVVIFVGASSSSGNNNNAPFLVMSEITVQDDGNGGDGRDLGNEIFDNCNRDDVNDRDGSLAADSMNNNNARDGERGLRMRDGGSLGAIEGEGGGYPGGSDTDDENDNGQESDGEYNPVLGGGEVMDVGTTTSSPPSSINAPLHKKSAPSDTASASSQPLRTLRRLQEMLDDTDYATHSVASSSLSSSSLSSMMTPTSSTANAGDVTNKNNDNDNEEAKNALAESSARATSSFAADNDLTSPPLHEKLWTSKDRAKYRRTRRTEKQRQQDENARKLRDMERQRIILEERKRKKDFLLSLREKEEELRQQQQQVPSVDETTDLTDDETDDGYGYYGGVGGGGSSMGFELPNLPVHLSDGETEDEEDDEDDKEINLHPSVGSTNNRNNPQDQQRLRQQQQQQKYHRAMQQTMTSTPPPLPGLNGGGIAGRPYYNIPEGQQQQQQPPPLHLPNKGPYQNYQQQYPHYIQQQLPPQQQQAGPLSQQYQYGHNPQQQQQQLQTTMQQNQYGQYDQEQYAAWAQAAAAANGYYYPILPPPPPLPPPLPPPPPHSSARSSFQGTPQQQQQSQQYPYISNPHLQQQNQGAASYAITAPQHLQHLYHLQQQQRSGGGPSSYSHIPPQQGAPLYHPHLPPPPPLQQQQQQQALSSYYQDSGSSSEQQQQQHQGVSAFNLKNNDVNGGWSIKWPLLQPQQLQQQQQQQHYGPHVNNDKGERSNTLAILTPTAGNALSATAAANLPEMTKGEADATTTATSSKGMSILGERTGMGVKPAFISPRSASTSMTSSGSSIGVAVASTVATFVETPIIKVGEDSIEQLTGDESVLISGANTKITFDSIQKVTFATVSMTLLSYCAVSPRSLPFPEYNRLFLQNLSIIAIATIAPVVTFLSVFDGRHNNINAAIGTFHVSFTLGYALALISEIVVTTAIRLAVFRIWEPAIFSLTPMVPSIILPWVLREKHYKPKRITLFAADFGASCLASPIIEEYLKLKVVQWTCNLPRNFKQSKKVQKSKRRRKQALQPVRSIDAPQVTNINCYVTQMLAASLGLKLFDVTRRILMYTKEGDLYKRTYAVCRGTFPIHELCGTMTALLLARRDVLGVNLPQWQILGPAVFIHGMANFRGMKPIFKWSSSTPWSEMQLHQLKPSNDHVWKQLLPKSYAKLVWLTILCRVYGFCIKNYYLIGRQAMKRTTTYSGKLHAFNAKLQTDAMLKKTKSD